jgi:hypothetical protein
MQLTSPPPPPFTSTMHTTYTLKSNAYNTLDSTSVNVTQKPPLHATNHTYQPRNITNTPTSILSRGGNNNNNNLTHHHTALVTPPTLSELSTGNSSINTNDLVYNPIFGKDTTPTFSLTDTSSCATAANFDPNSTVASGRSTRVKFDDTNNIEYCYDRYDEDNNNAFSSPRVMRREADMDQFISVVESRSVSSCGNSEEDSQRDRDAIVVADSGSDNCATPRLFSNFSLYSPKRVGDSSAVADGGAATPLEADKLMKYIQTVESSYQQDKSTSNQPTTSDNSNAGSVSQYAFNFKRDMKFFDVVTNSNNTSVYSGN